MNPLEHVRESIRAAVTRANPIDEARRSIELIAETSVRYSDRGSEPSIYIIDEMGERRTKTEGGRTVDFSIDDLIAEIKTKHPALFKRGSAAAAPPAATAVAEARPVAETSQQMAVAAPLPMAAPMPATMPAAAGPASRDWLVVGGAPAASSPAARAATPAAPIAPVTSEAPEADVPRAPRVEGASSGPKAQGWFRMLGSAGPVIRIASNGMVSRLSGFSAGLRRHREIPVGVGMAGEGLRRVAGPVMRVSAAAVLLLIGGSLVYGLGSLALRSNDEPTRTAAGVSAPREPTTTGSVSGTRPAAEPANAARTNDNGPIRGVPEVLDTATLSIHGKVVRLFGIEWVRGAGEPADLASYIRGRETICEPAKAGATTYRCTVEGQDLSKVVLFNGGGRATSEASPDLQAAEAHAKSSKAGLWAKGG